MTPEQQTQRFDERVLFIAPTRHDAEATRERLLAAQLTCFACDDLTALASHVVEGAGAVMLSDASLGAPGFATLHAALGRQPAWSDVPVLMLTREAEPSAQAAAALALLPNVTLLDEPVSARAMVSAVQSAVRARRRQYEIRAQLEQCEAAEHALREADRRRDEFLATLAHELRNPLAPLRTALHVLDKLPAGAPQSAMLHRLMQRQVTRLARLIDELLGGRDPGHLPALADAGLTAADAELLAAADLLAEAPPPRPGPVRPLRVLVVDDNVDAAETLAMYLCEDGHEVRTAHDGASALREALTFAPEVVVCDLGMPGLDGHAVARALRADPRHAGLVLVALTGWGSDEDRRRTRASGFDFHLVKPVEPQALERLIAGL